MRAPYVYSVQVERDSTEGAEIYSGDLLIVDRSNEAKHDDIVIAPSNKGPGTTVAHLAPGSC